MWNMELDIRFKMKKIAYVFALTSLLIQLTSCKKAENRTCFKSTGKDKTITISLPYFNKLWLNPHLEYVLIQDSTDQLVIQGGENLVNLVEWKIDSDDVLTITNGNKCNFLRKLNKKIRVEIHFTNVYNLHFEGTEPLTNIDTLDMPYFVMLIRDGAGSVNLKLKSIFLQADISHGWGDYTLAGSTKTAHIAARSNGYCDVTALNVTDSMYVSSETSGTIKVRANGIPLAGEIRAFGDIWYYGTPSSISVAELSEGRLIGK